MYNDLLAINKERHATSYVAPVESYAYASNVHFAGVAIHEFPKVAALYPVVFMQTDSGDFTPVALLGLDEGRNLFVNERGQWTVSYVPAVIRKYPFVLVSKDADSTEFVVCVDQASGCIKADEGRPLFTEQGDPAPALQGVIRFLSELQEMDVHTRRFCQQLKMLGLLVPLNVELRSNSGVRRVAGAFVVDEVALNNLGAEQKANLQSQNYMPTLYAHLLSLGQFERLVNLADAALLKRADTAPENAVAAAPAKPASPVKKTRKRSR